MPEYQSPGVYVEEVSSGIKPIEGVGTATGAFVGRAEKGPVDKPVLITNFIQFVATFGGFHPGFYLAYAVRCFFLEGGTRCYVVRVFRGTDPDHPEQDRASVELTDAAGTAVLRVSAISAGEWGKSLTIEIQQEPAFDPGDPANADKRFKLIVQSPRPGDTPEILETYASVTLKEFTADGKPHPAHVEAVINGASAYVTVDDLGTDPMQFDPPAEGSSPLTGGSDGQALTGLELTGDEAKRTGLYAFDPVDDINIVAIPDLMSLVNTDAQGATLAGLTYCQNRKDCFFVADAPQRLTPQEVLDYRQAKGNFSAGNPFNSSFGALYYPWIWVDDPVTGGRRLCPPSGAIAGSFSGTDVKRGVHKAPAGTEDGYLNSALGVERMLTTGEQDILNPNGVNVIRKFPEAGIVIWGARTLTADPEWKYVNVRRLFLFLEESIDQGTQWVVFEPNDPVLWKRIVRNVGAFLRVQWREGKLVGLKEEEAFFVKCDEETNPPESVDLGRVITVIGVAPSKPAEFVIFRISQFRLGAD